jgi:hypothetical protein
VGVSWIYLAQGSDKWGAIVHAGSVNGGWYVDQLTSCELSSGAGWARPQLHVSSCCLSRYPLGKHEQSRRWMWKLGCKFLYERVIPDHTRKHPPDSKWLLPPPRPPLVFHKSIGSYGNSGGSLPLNCTGVITVCGLLRVLLWRSKQGEWN